MAGWKTVFRPAAKFCQGWQASATLWQDLAI